MFILPAAAWSCVEKMLQLDQVISAPSSTKVSIRTAVYDLKQENIISIQFDRNISLQGNSIIDSSICRLITWMVMWRHPAILAPFNGLLGPYFLRRYIRPGISFSAMSSSFLPNSAKLISAVNTNRYLYFW